MVKNLTGSRNAAYTVIL